MVVVGAGPAGAATALLLARAGFGVTIVERATFPRRKVCGDYLGAGALDVLDRLGLGEQVAALGSPLRGIRLYTGGAASVELPFHRKALAIARSVLDGVVLEAAVAAGAALVHGRVENIVYDQDRAAGVVFRDERGDEHELRARFVVGADGIGSLVARKLGLYRAPRGRSRYAIGGQYAGFAALDGCIEMYAGPSGYFALNPLSRDLANVMVVQGKEAFERAAGGVDRKMFQTVVELAQGRRSFAGTARIGPRVAIGPLEHGVTSRVGKGALLAGDAGGFVDPFTGQGVFLALSDGERAATALRAAFGSRANETSAMQAYERASGSEKKARAGLAALVGALVDTPFLARRAASRLQRSPGLAQTLLDALAGAASARTVLHPLVLGRLLL